MTRWQTLQLIISLLTIALVCVFYVDLPVALTITDQPDIVLTIAKAITELGEAWIWLALSAVAWIAFRRIAMKTPFMCRRVHALKAAAASAFLFIAVAVSGIVADIFKVVIGRPRPRLLRDNGDFTGVHPFSFDAHHQSFPSGHTTTIFAVAVALSFFYPRARVWIFLAAITVAISRVVVGAHYPSDVAGGALVGVLTAYELRRFWERKWRLPFKKV